MRITTHIPDPLARDAKIMAENEKKIRFVDNCRSPFLLHHREKKAKTWQTGVADCR